jgi:hypothetical protein
VSFVGEALIPLDGAFDADGPARGEPVIPRAFRWHDDELVITGITRRWRSTKDDRGDTYLKRHWYEMRLADGRTAVTYFDRGARRGTARWWLYTIV